MEASEEELTNTASRFLCLGLGLLYLGKEKEANNWLHVHPLLCVCGSDCQIGVIHCS